MTAPKPPRPPRRRGVTLNGADTDRLRVESEKTCRDLRIARANITAGSYAFVDLGTCDLRYVRAGGTEWERCTFGDLRVEQCDLSNLELSDSGLLRSRIDESRATGMAAAGSLVTDVDVRNCSMDLSKWRFSRFQRVAFDNCRLVESDWTSAELGDVTFTDCDLSGSRFSQCTMNRVHFSGCALEGITGLTDLSGSSMEPADALSLYREFAAALGITVQENPERG
ncbi:uncharacterized protein YjbI with pentapeptide repeats [Haloactinospora alba]|uniref:Uncharacterized protein YjbI with pentapeptide repeats n=1 Tax=Haloactinospora alba TaxID=405555 RepID=A0A543NP82_9ACTN|nr:pentapeptide repeat-containing protein [Haloactinospora alba]TQN33557.1 uncharacterized protein YjbI with pentapeptide repeats [Haloactinospora alba]